MTREEVRTALPRWRRAVHAHAEEGWTEFWTTAFVARTLQELGLTPRVGTEVLDSGARMGLPTPEVRAAARRRAAAEGADGTLLARMGDATGAVVDVGPAGQPVALALRFDMDALPLQESADPEHAPAAGGYASRHAGQCHACGHDAHVALGLGLAACLQQAEVPLRQRVRCIFQPAEEGVRGAAPLRAQVEGVPRFLAVHLGLGQPSGTLFTGVTGLMASTKFDALFMGQAAHAGKAPEQGRDALKGAAAALLGLHDLPRYGTGENRVHVGCLRGGTARNVVAQTALLQGETRAVTCDMADDLFARARGVLAGAAAMYGLRHRLRLAGQCPAADSDAAFAAQLARWAREVRLEDGRAAFARVEEQTGMGASDDAATFMRAVQQQGGQVAYAILGSSGPAGHHDPRFDVDESVLWPGVLWLEHVCRRLAG